MYLLGLINATMFIALTVLVAMGINRLREWWEARQRRRDSR